MQVINMYKVCIMFECSESFHSRMSLKYGFSNIKCIDDIDNKYVITLVYDTKAKATNVEKDIVKLLTRERINFTVDYNNVSNIGGF